MQHDPAMTGENLEPEPKMDGAEIERLAQGSEFAYERERKASAKKLGVRVSVLDKMVEGRRTVVEEENEPSLFPKLDPWPEPVDGAELLGVLVATFTRFLALPDHAAEALALWTVHTHTFDAGAITPRLALTSPKKRCGKSTALGVLQKLVPRPLPAANITAASFFRAVEKWRPTVLVDEADTFLRGNDELRGILNAGHRRDGCVIRSVGDDHEPRAFKVWAPVAIAMIGRLPDTLEDRSIVVSMRRKLPNEGGSCPTKMYSGFVWRKITGFPISPASAPDGPPIISMLCTNLTPMYPMPCMIVQRTTGGP